MRVQKMMRIACLVAMFVELTLAEHLEECINKLIDELSESNVFNCDGYSKCLVQIPELRISELSPKEIKDIENVHEKDFYNQGLVCDLDLVRALNEVKQQMTTTSTTELTMAEHLEKCAYKMIDELNESDVFSCDGYSKCLVQIPELRISELSPKEIEDIENKQESDFSNQGLVCVLDLVGALNEVKQQMATTSTMPTTTKESTTSTLPTITT